MARFPALTIDVSGKRDKILSCLGKSSKILSFLCPLGIWLQVLKVLHIQHYFWIFMLLMTSSDFMADE